VDAKTLAEASTISFSSSGEADACQGAKRSVRMLGAHTSKGGVWLVVLGGDTLS